MRTWTRWIIAWTWMVVVSVTLTAPHAFAQDVFDRAWDLHIWGASIGETGLLPVDLDGDGRLEIVAGRSAAGGFSDNDTVVVFRHQPDGEYVITWSSLPLDPAISRLTVASIDGKPKILVGRANGRVRVYDGATLAYEREAAVTTSPITALDVADVDGDGKDDVVVVTASTTFLLDATTFIERRRIAYGGSDAKLGNVDTDPQIELVLPGKVLQLTGSGVLVEWNLTGTYPTGARLALGDLDGDGIDEIVSARTWYNIDVYDAVLRTRRLLISTELDIGAVLAADLDGDGRDELLYGDSQWGEIHALEGLAGVELWAIDNPEHGTTRLAVADTDDDGALEVMWGAGASSTSEDHLFVHDVASRELEFVNVDQNGPFSATEVGDVDDDGELELVTISWESDSGYSDGVVQVFDARTNTLEWRSPARFFERLPKSGIHDLAIGDIDGDGNTEMVIATDRLDYGTIIVLDGRTHAIERRTVYDKGSPIYVVTLVDLEGDGIVEIVAGGGKGNTGSPGTFLYVIDGPTGAVRWQEKLGTNWPGVWSIEPADLNGDGVTDFLVSLEYVFAVDGATRALTRTVAAGYLGLAVTDADADDVPEVWAGTTDGMLVELDPTTLAATPAMRACATTSPLNALVWAEPSLLAGTLLLACDDRFLKLDLATRSLADVTSPNEPSLGPSLGYNDNLMAVELDFGWTILGAGRGTGVVVYGSYGANDPDPDLDGIPSHHDVCPAVYDPDQADRDLDGRGDACEDGDGDGVRDLIDVCPSVPDPEQRDTDGDGRGDACDDDDADGVLDVVDNCLGLANPEQTDSDSDGLGDACDDGDGDGAPGGLDNCEGLSNPDQSDVDGDGIGDACDDDTSPGSLVVDSAQLKLDVSPSRDTGTVRLEMVVEDSDTGGGLLASVVAGTAKVIVADAGDFAATLPLSGCKERAPGVARCRTLGREEPRVTVSITRRRESATRFTVMLKATWLPEGMTGTRTPVGPARVVLQQGLVTRVGTIGTCVPKRGHTLVCDR